PFEVGKLSPRVLPPAKHRIRTAPHLCSRARLARWSRGTRAARSLQSAHASGVVPVKPCILPPGRHESALAGPQYLLPAARFPGNCSRNKPMTADAPRDIPTLRTTLYTAVVADVLDALGHRNQAIRQPLP